MSKEEKMAFISIFNDVLGPVMRGPSSSHTAGSYRIGRIARSLLGEEPVSAVFSFDPEGSYAKTYKQQGADPGFAAGLMGWTVPGERVRLELTGKTHDRLVECEEAASPQVEALVKSGKPFESITVKDHRQHRVLVHLQGPVPLSEETLRPIQSLRGVHRIWSVPSVFFVQRGEPLFSNAAEMTARAKSRGTSLGRG